MPPAPQPPLPPPDGYDYGPALPTAGSGPMNRIRRYLILLRKFWWVPLVTLVLGAGGAAAFLRFQDPVYVSVGRLWVTGKLNLPQAAVFSEDVQNYFGTQISLLESDRLQQLAFEQLSAKDPKAVPKGPDGLPLPVEIKASQAPKSTIINVFATGASPEYTRAFLEAIFTAFLELKREIRAQASGDTLTSLTEQLRRQEQDLKAEQDKLIAFRRDNNLAMLQEQGNAAGGYLVKLYGQLADLRLELQLLEASAFEPPVTPLNRTNDPATASAAGTATNAVGTPPGAPAELHAARQQVQALRIQRDQLGKYLRPQHPKMIRLAEEIERADRLLEAYRAQTAEQLAATRQGLKIKIETIEASVKTWETNVGEANSRLVEYDRLLQNVDRMQSLRDRLLPLLQSIDVNRNIDQDTVSILQRPSPPRVKRLEPIPVFGIALFLGLAAGLGIVFLLELTNDRLMSVEDVLNRFEEEILGLIPEVQQPKRHPQPLLLEPDDPRHAFAESCRSLRSSLLFGHRSETRPKTLLITSAEPSEGKSTVAANLALALASAGSRVLLIDADLRRSSLHHFFRLTREPGLGNLLETQANPEQFNLISPTSNPNLFVIPSGRPASNCGELILSPTFDRLLEEIQRDFDFAIFDSIPVFASDDATTLAPKLDGVLFVVRAGQSRARVVRQALDLLYQRQAKVLGLIVNRADSQASHYSYYRYPEYQHDPKNGQPIPVPTANPQQPVLHGPAVPGHRTSFFTRLLRRSPLKPKRALSPNAGPIPIVVGRKRHRH